MCRKNLFLNNRPYKKVLSGALVTLPAFSMYGDSGNVGALFLEENVQKSVISVFFSKLWESFSAYIISLFFKKHKVCIYDNRDESRIMHSEEIPEGQEGVFRLLFIKLLFEDIGKVSCIERIDEHNDELDIVGTKYEGKDYENKFNQQMEEAEKILQEVKDLYGKDILGLGENFKDDELTKKYREEFLKGLEKNEYDELTERVYKLSFLCSKAKIFLDELKVKYKEMSREIIFKNVAFLFMVMKEISEEKADLYLDIEEITSNRFGKSEIKSFYSSVSERVKSFLYNDVNAFLKQAEIPTEFMETFRSRSAYLYDTSTNIDLIFCPVDGQEKGNFFEIRRHIGAFEGLVYAMGKNFFGCSEIKLGYKGVENNNNKRRVRRIMEEGEEISSKAEEIENKILNKRMPYLTGIPVGKAMEEIRSSFSAGELVVGEVGNLLDSCFFLIESGNDKKNGFINECACSLLFIKYREQLMKRINDYSISKDVKIKLVSKCEELLNRFISEHEREYGNHLFSFRAKDFYKEFEKSKVFANESNKMNLGDVFFIENEEFNRSDNLPSLNDIKKEDENDLPSLDDIEKEKRKIKEKVQYPSFEDKKSDAQQYHYPIWNEENKNIVKNFGQQKFVNIEGAGQKSKNNNDDNDFYLLKDEVSDEEGDGFCLFKNSEQAEVYPNINEF